ncbi:MAG: CRISPR-associated protein Csx11 [Acidobacteriia bacterium]|nr:CRISPR-associated protein Csx11 [Methyloceanibacter sp.]MCL6490451.1 CRISPR-associated protein Csx11 [Terriglobia bacterium]
MSNGAQMLATLRHHRPLPLAMEAIGWLHMTGKAHPDFLRQQGGQNMRYDYKGWHERENPPFDWDSLLCWVTNKFNQIDSKQIWSPKTFTEFVTKHDGGDGIGVLGLLQAAHGITSGIEKNLSRSTSEYLKQDIAHMWLASPFGHPVRNLLADPPELLAPGGWQRVIDEIRRMLGDLKKFGASGTASVEDWWGWREAAIGPQSFLRKAFSSTLAETRLPNNDVTLWDQSYVTAALFKSALAGAILTANTFPCDKVKQTTQWRVLTIGFGTRHYEARAVKIGDWTGARRDIEKFFKQVACLIEVDLAVGSLVYRDHETLAFSFPGQHAGGGGLGNTAADSLKDEIQKEIDCLADALNLETPPLCQLSGSTRSFVPMVAELRKAREQLAVPVHRPWTVPAADARTGGGLRHVCPVCLVRLNAPPTGAAPDNARKSFPCSVCRERRRGRLDAWLSGNEDTIWISEVADGNDRVALLTLSLGLEPWLEGEHVDSLRAQSIAEWRRFNPVLKNPENTPNPIDPSASFQKLVDYVRPKLSNFDKNDPVLRGLQEGYQHENDWAPFFKKIVEDRSGAPDWTKLNDNQRAHWLVHQLFRKLPSPGRMYRFWRTAETFFDDLLTRFREIAAAHDNRWRTRRLCFKPDDNAAGQGWEDRETYLGHWRGVPFEVVYLKDRQAFVTIANLARCFRPEDTMQALEQGTQPITVKGDDGTQRGLRGKSVSAPEQIGVYAPVIPLDLSPQRFRMLVPLDRATACLEAAIAKWREEFVRVWDRMPLRIGVVAFPRLTPFQAVIEAARRLEDALDKQGTETWRVIGCREHEGVMALSLKCDRARELVVLPSKLPDGRDDVFYPYAELQNGELRAPRDFQHPEGRIYRHMADLRPGDGIVVHPSRIAAVFLDTTARRFEPPDVWPLGGFERMRNVWELLVRRAPSLSALRGAWSELEERAQTWRDAHGRWLPGAEDEWRDLARAILQDRLAVSGAVLEALVEAAADGTLAWALAWHLTWLKEGLEGAQT